MANVSQVCVSREEATSCPTSLCYKRQIALEQHELECDDSMVHRRRRGRAAWIETFVSEESDSLLLLLLLLLL